MNLKYELASPLGYRFDIAKIGRSPYDINMIYDKSQFPDVEITRGNRNLDLDLLDRRYLFTLNGLVQHTVYENDRFFIKDGSTYLMKNPSRAVGLLSFSQLDTDLIKHKIEVHMVHKDPVMELYDRAIITFPVPIEGSVILVMAGYLVFEQEGFLERVSENSFVIYLRKLNYDERIYELSRHRDIFKDLDIEASSHNPSMTNVVQLRKNDAIKKFLSLDNSFLVEVPGHYIDVEKRYLDRSTIPNEYRTELEPIYPLVGGVGKLIEYKKLKKNRVKWNLYTTDSYVNNYLFSTVPRTNFYYEGNQLDSINDHRQPGRTYRLSNAFFLDVKFTPID